MEIIETPTKFGMSSLCFSKMAGEIMNRDRYLQETVIVGKKLIFVVTTFLKQLHSLWSLLCNKQF